MLITSDIIARYNLQVDDASELSTDEELALANEVYFDVCNDRPWEWLKSTFTDVTSTTLPYINLPANFKELAHNRDNRSVIFIGADMNEYKVVPFSSRRDYYNQDGFCYIDIPNQRLYFMKQPTEVKSIEFDYIKYPISLTLSTEPLFTSTYHPIIAYGMAAKFTNIEQQSKGKNNSSYQKENQIEYNNFMSNLRMEDSNIKLAM